MTNNYYLGLEIKLKELLCYRVWRYTPQDKKNFMDEKWMAALISFSVSILVLFAKSVLDRVGLRSKLDTEYKFEQRKQIKDVLAKYKMHLLIACEDFNHRMWNFSVNYSQRWMTVEGEYLEKNNYYFHSFIYRLLVIFAWSKKVQREMIFLDTTVAKKGDLEFVKFLSVFPRFFCDLKFIEGEKADGNQEGDHFYRDEFEFFSNAVIGRDGVTSFTSYLESIPQHCEMLSKLNHFFDAINPEENRKRWHRVHLFHLCLLVFLNNYGYDYQRTNDEKLKQILNQPVKSPYFSNFVKLMQEYHLDKNKEFKKLVKLEASQRVI